jgi:hypothetical protein
MEIDSIFSKLKKKKNSGSKKAEKNNTPDNTVATSDPKISGEPVSKKDEIKKRLMQKIKDKKKNTGHNKFSAKDEKKPRRKTSDGYKIYTEEELGLNIKSKNGPDCPFDCNCCF